MTYCETPNFSPMYSLAVKSAAFLGVEEEADLLARWQQGGDTDALCKIILSHSRLVLKRARRRPKMYSLTDMVQEGNLGIMKAADRWTPERNVRFSAYAKFWIDAYIASYIKGASSAVTIKGKGGHLQIQIAYLSDTMKSRDPAVERDVVVATIAKRVKAAPQVVSAVLDVQASADVNLDASYQDSDDSLGGIVLADECDVENDVMTRLDGDRQHTALLSALDQLDERTRRIILGRYGIGQERVTLEYLAEEFSRSRERIRQIERNGLLKLRVLMRGGPTAPLDM